MEIVTVDKITNDHIKQINSLFKNPTLRRFLIYSEEDGLELKKTRDFVEQKRKEFKEKKSILWVALENGNVQGAVEARFFPLTKQKHKISFGIWVRIDKHRQGIGSRLIEHLILYAKANNFKRIEGEMFCENKAALALYKKYGFIVEGRMKCAIFYKGKCEDEYAISKLL